MTPLRSVLGLLWLAGELQLAVSFAHSWHTLQRASNTGCYGRG